MIFAVDGVLLPPGTSYTPLEVDYDDTASDDDDDSEPPAEPERGNTPDSEDSNSQKVGPVSISLFKFSFCAYHG